jgi:hypothetical protein
MTGPDRSLLPNKPRFAACTTDVFLTALFVVAGPALRTDSKSALAFIDYG